MIYILSKYPQLDRGHYWAFDGYLRRALRENKLEHRFLNPSARIALNEDQQLGPINAGYVTVEDEGRFIQNAIDYISQDVKSETRKKITLLIPWLPQFTLDEIQKLDKIEEFVEVKFVGLTTLSPQQIQGHNNLKIRYEFEEYFAGKSDRILWVSDLVPQEYIQHKFIREFPDFAEVNVNRNEKETWDISFFGLLTPYRGIFEILVIGLFNPKVKIRIKGYGFAKHMILRPWKYRIFRYQNWRKNPIASIFFSGLSVLTSTLLHLPNIDFSDEPFETEEDLDRGISQTKFMFYCPKLPHGSGLTNKSLAAGIPILWHGWQGKAFSMLSENYPQGYLPYYKFFIPNYVSRKLNSLDKPLDLQKQMWAKFSSEVLMIQEQELQ
jgi:hypothetical protein